MTENAWFHFNLYVVWPLAYRLRRMFAPHTLREPSGAYSFERAKKYWQNVPRARGANSLDTARLETFSDGELLRLFEREMEIAEKKKERRIGFNRALESIAATDQPEVMDYGSGFGFYGFKILSKHSGSRVTFVDINEANLKVIERIAKMEGIEDRVTCLTVPDERAEDFDPRKSFDFILSMGVLHHTPHAPQIVRNLSRFLKKDGIFEVMLYNKNYRRKMEFVSGRKLNEAAFGAMTDPRTEVSENPYSEAYDDEMAKRLFEGYELLSADYPHPFYNTYRFKKR